MEAIVAKLCEGRVAVVTGAGRGIGREHALSLASEGAKVVVNDLGGNVDGSGGDVSPAQSVVDEIKAMGGEAVANGDDISSWEGSQRLINTAVETFGDINIVVNNAGILRDRMLTNMTEEEGCSYQSAPQGNIWSITLGSRILARTSKSWQANNGSHH